MLSSSRTASFEVQLADIDDAYGEVLDALGVDYATVVFRRFFCSDLANQVDGLRKREFSNSETSTDLCAVSWTGQAPLPDGKVALWAYHIDDPTGPLKKSRTDGALLLDRGELAHHWLAGMNHADNESSHHQTMGIFTDYARYLGDHGMTLADHTVRTWLYVQNIDSDYQGLVDARREFFLTHALTPDTHYITSTGIGGGQVAPDVRASMDAYAIDGLQKEQVEFLTALDHLGPTQAYGVTFERGVALAYQDRKHLLISGTASIDPEGTILHRGDVGKQLDRTLENIDALLASGGGGLGDVTMFIVYIRDPADHRLAKERMRERFGDVPMVVVLGPVCRPGWLIEIEAIATVANAADHLPSF